MSYTEISKVNAKARLKVFLILIAAVSVVGALFEYQSALQPLAQAVVVYQTEEQPSTTPQTIPAETMPLTQDEPQNDTPQQKQLDQTQDDALGSFLDYMNQVQEETARDIHTTNVLDRIVVDEPVSTPQPVEQTPASASALSQEQPHSEQDASQPQPAEETLVSVPSAEQPVDMLSHVTSETHNQQTPPPAISTSQSENIVPSAPETPSETSLDSNQPAEEESAPSANEPENLPSQPIASESSDENEPVMLIPSVSMSSGTAQ